MQSRKKRAAIIYFFVVLAGASVASAQPLRPVEAGTETVAQAGPPTGGNKDDAERSLRVTIHPTRPWESYVAPNASDPLQRAPVSATTYDETTLRDSPINGVEDVATITPGMQTSGLTNRITLRGAGDLVLFTSAQSPVGLYVDDVYIPGAGAFNFDIFDTERVEILRGPQGFSGGRGAIAGDVRIRTTGAKPVNSGSVSAGLGTYEQIRLRTSANRTTDDKTVSNRLAAMYVHRNGTVRNLSSGEKIDTRNNWGVRDHLAFRRPSGTAADLSLDFADYSPVRPAAGGFDSVLDGDVSIFAPQTEDRQIYGTALHLRRPGKSVDVSSITALRGFEYDSFGSDYGPNNLLNQGLEQSQHYASQELRFSPSAAKAVDGTGGAYFYGEMTDQEADIQLINSAGSFGVAPGHTETSHADTRLWTAAAFTDMTWHVNARTDLYGGLRMSYDHHHLHYRYGSSDGIARLALIQTRNESKAFTGLSWKIGGSYELMPGVKPYVTVSRGAKPGGFNTVQLQSSEASFGRETATNYEIGLKSEWFSGAMVANAAMFYLQRDGQQVQNIGAFGAPTVNANKSRSRGVELTLTGRPLPGLDLFLGYSYLDTKFTDFPDFPKTGGGTLDLAGRTIPFASSHSGSAGLRYVVPVTDTEQLVLRTDFSYRTGFYFDAVNSLRQPAYGLLNARAALRGDMWELSLWGKNLTDTGYRVSAATDALNGKQAIAGDPRTYGVDFRYKF